MGNLFQDYRNALGIDLDNVSKALRISKYYLQAIENEEFRKLPGDVYARGYMREYARFLGIKADDALAGYVRYLGDSARAQVDICPETATSGGQKRGVLRSRSKRSDLFVRMGSAMALLLLFCIFLPAKNTFTHMVTQSIETMVSREVSRNIHAAHRYEPLLRGAVVDMKRSDATAVPSEGHREQRPDFAVEEVRGQMLQEVSTNAAAISDFVGVGVDSFGDVTAMPRDKWSWDETVIAAACGCVEQGSVLLDEDEMSFSITCPPALGIIEGCFLECGGGLQVAAVSLSEDEIEGYPQGGRSPCDDPQSPSLSVVETMTDIVIVIDQSYVRNVCSADEGDTIYVDGLSAMIPSPADPVLR